MTGLVIPVNRQSGGCGINIVLRARLRRRSARSRKTPASKARSFGKITENKSQTFGSQTEQYVDMLSAGEGRARRSPGRRVDRRPDDHDRGHGRGGSEEEGGSSHAGRRHGRHGRHGLLISWDDEPGTAAVRPRDRPRADAGERGGHDADQRPVADYRSLRAMGCGSGGSHFYYCSYINTYIK